jgi:thimet oligopeptidase
LLKQPYKQKLASLSGFPNFVEMVMQSRMAGSEAGQRDFLAEVDRASKDAANAQAKLLLEAKSRDVPSATSLDFPDLEYYIRRLRDQRYHFNEQYARAYFPYVRVKESVFSSASKMFGIEFKSVTVPVWHPSVEAYDVLEKGQIIGRIYLDMFPRPNKYQHFATNRSREGVLGKQLPEGVLICNFTAPTNDNPGLMEPSMAQTFFHEFGHLLHGVFSGREKWAGLNRPELDFNEAPSQLLEEWYKNPKVLSTFARHYQTGETIPQDLVERMVRAGHFGTALETRMSLWLSNISLAYHSGNGKVDLDGVSRDLYVRCLGIAPPADLHMWASFPHLGNSYAATYYTYEWSLVIAKDLFTKFDEADLLSPGPAGRYRQAILNQAGSAPAAKLIEHFLGRPFNLRAYQAWLQTE